MAHGYLEHFAKGKANIYSAGVETHDVNPTAIAIMKEDGIDISNHTSNHVDEYADIPFDFIITVCDHAKERCPVFPSTARQFHENFPDPSKFKGSDEDIHAEFVRVRNLIKEYCNCFVQVNL